MAVNLTKIGGLVKVEPTGINTFYINPLTSYVRFYLNETSERVQIVLGETKLTEEDFTGVSVAGEACTDQEDFETKIATVFPSAGAAAIPTLAQVLEAGNNAGAFDIDMGGKKILGAILYAPTIEEEFNGGGVNFTNIGSIDTLGYKINGTNGATQENATTVTVIDGIVTSAS